MITNSKYDASQYGFYLLGGVGSKEEAVFSTRGLKWSDQEKEVGKESRWKLDGIENHLDDPNKNLCIY